MDVKNHLAPSSFAEPLGYDVGCSGHRREDAKGFLLAIKSLVALLTAREDEA